MRFDCDAFAEDRDYSEQWNRSLNNPFNQFGEIDPDLAAFLATPGFLPQHFARLFYWSKPMIERMRAYRPALMLRPEVVAQGLANAASIGCDEALGWTQFEACRVIPYWTVVALREQPYQRGRGLHWGVGGEWLGRTMGWNG